VFAIDTASGRVLARLKVGLRPRGVAFTNDGKTGFVTNENGGTVSVIDAVKHKVAATITLPKIEGAPMASRPMGMAFSPDGATLYVSLGRAGAVAVIDVAARKLLRTINDVGERPWGIAVSADGQTLYTANGPGGDVSIVDIASGSVKKHVTVGGSPWGVTFVVR
jgi:YVTN family beta-propeller protein